MRMSLRWVWVWALLGSASVWADEFSDRDPFEPFNRKVFWFNDTMDTYLFRPVAKGYRWVVPDYLEARLTGAFMNLGEVRNVANNTFQFKFKSAGRDVSRLVINSTVGLLGMYDVATHWGLDRSDEDFGQTLATWGMPSGPYLVMPFAGPSTVRETAGGVGDYWFDPLSYSEQRSFADKVNMLRFIELRARFLSVEDLAAGDKYSFIRNAYLQRRDFLIRDGETAFDEWEDEWGDEEDDAEIDQAGNEEAEAGADE